MDQYRFTAQKCAFNGKPGYIVTQYRPDGTKASDGWTPAEEYAAFCAAIGIEPEEITED